MLFINDSISGTAISFERVIFSVLILFPVSFPLFNRKKEEAK
jgi:hypothetical protein